MSTSRKQKACIPCTRAKRKCGKELPECERCFERDIDCSYPPVKSRRRRDPGGRTAGAELGQEAAWKNGPEAASASGLGNLDLADWTYLGAPELSLQTPSSDTTAASSVWSEASWFMDPGTWLVAHNYRAVSPSPPAKFRNFVNDMHSELRQWITTGSNGFIHNNIVHGDGLPPCLQDAFTATAAYLSRTPATEDLVLDILENRATALLSLYQSPTISRTLDVPSHLARVQALLAYHIIRLFDGCIRQRARAEQFNDVLLQWAQEMYHVGTREVEALLQRGAEALACCHEDTVRSTLLWRAWVLCESVRRTWLTVTTLLSVYMTKKQGLSECYGGIMLTARKGLWEAPTASRWLDQTQESDHLFVQSLNLEELFKERASEVDGFALQLFPLFTDAEKLDDWLRRTGQEATSSTPQS